MDPSDEFMTVEEFAALPRSGTPAAPTTTGR